MKLQRLGILAGIALTATVALAACGTDNNNTPSNGSSGGAKASGSANCATGTLNAQGSTAQANAISTWIKDYNAQCSGATINYQAHRLRRRPDGVHRRPGRLRRLRLGAEAGRPAEGERALRLRRPAAIHLPMVVGPIAVVYNVSGVTNLQFKPATIAGIFSGKITTWNDPAIAADNPGVKLPSTKITPVHRADSSGTTDNFTKYLTKTAAGAWTFDHDKVWHAPGGDAEKGSDGVSKFIASTDGSIGYDEWSFATLNNLNMAKIFNGAGEWSTLTADSAGKTIAGAQTVGTGNDLQMTIDYTTTTPGAYPIVLVTYEIVCDKGNPAGSLNLLKSFLGYTSSTAGQQVLTRSATPRCRTRCAPRSRRPSPQ